MQNLIKEISEIFIYSKLSKDNLYLSTKLNKLGNPIVRIDSKEPIKALMLKFTDNSITIKSIVNSTGEKRFSKKVIDIILSNIDKEYNIIIDQDVSDGFWDSVIQKNPDYNWIML
jgi:hypothetical protein